MTEFDPLRVALVAAEPAEDSASGESVATGYFLTGDLVLTVGHVADRPDWTFRVRAEVGGPDDHWSAAKPQWTGGSGVDAMLLRTTRQFGDWAPPSFSTDMDNGTWQSSGYPKAAADEKKSNRKTLPLKGSFGISRGQGPQELALRTEYNISPNWDTYWKGISGAPVFSAGQDDNSGLIGIITDASRALLDGLVGLPIMSLLDDIHFRSIIYPSFLGQLPANPFCLVLTSETSTSDLIGQTSGVISGFGDVDVQFQELHKTPVEIPILKAVESVENWAATVDAVARADYLIADVTSFEPAVMLLLGIRSVLRRGVTISVTDGPSPADITGGKPADISSELPFNVKETRVLSFKDNEDFYDDLHLAMAEGAANLSRDANYLDLPAYLAVRSPRPESWAETDRDSMLVLCPFMKDYSNFYEKKLRQIIRGHTGNKIPSRMIDLKSPRLVGQALYEQIRWSSWCIVDWSHWRANVFFELGVRLACSERDPLCIIQRSDDPRDQQSGELRQKELLQKLINPVIYDPKDPREKLKAALESWSKQPLLVNERSPSQETLPSAATFSVAQDSFLWQTDAMLTSPHIEQRREVELIFGSDPEKQPERLVLFSDNKQFEAKLQAAAIEKWIAAWLYLRHLSTADDALRSNDAELNDVANRVLYALNASQDPRHIQLRQEIDDFLETRTPPPHIRIRRVTEGDASNG